MVNFKENEIINANLSALYMEYSEKILNEWAEAFPNDPEGVPCRINEFGIIDVHKYDSSNGVLFIGRETNGWKNTDYASGCLFRDWMNDITRNGLVNLGHITQFPNMWYNIGRWAMLLGNPENSITDIAHAKAESISEIGNVAFTNVNKVRGFRSSGKEYFKLAQSPVTKELLRKEIEIIDPKIIVCCGTTRPVCPLPGNFKGALYVMPHPAARKSKLQMLLELKQQIDN